MTVVICSSMGIEVFELESNVERIGVTIEVSPFEGK